MEQQPDGKCTLWGISCYYIYDPGNYQLWPVHWIMEMPLLIVKWLHQLVGKDYSVVVKETYRKIIVEREDE